MSIFLSSEKDEADMHLSSKTEILLEYSDLF